MPLDEGAAGGLARWWRPLLGEVVATALLMILGLGSLLPPDAVQLTHPALAFGFVVTALIQAFGPVCGAHMNPAVTLAALICGQIPALPALGYVVAQVIGAIGGFGVLEAAVPLSACEAVAAPGGGAGPGGALLVEALMTATLVLTVAGVWADHRAGLVDTTVPIKLGLTIAGLVYAGGKLTGAALNPARALAPALWRGCWAAQWVYWAGPLAGAALAAALHRWLLLPASYRPPHRAAPTATREELPLHDKPDH